MRKSIAFKNLLRSPLKTLLTLLLIAAASFALFSRVTDYAITTRESAKAESFYYGVAALDNSSPPMGDYFLEPKEWPDDAHIQEFSSLPGVTLADTRYTTDGFIEDYKRVIDSDASFTSGDFVVEGTYEGFEEYDYGSAYLLLNDVTVHAGELEIDPDWPLKVQVFNYGNAYRHTYPREFFDELKKGSRYLVIGVYSERTGSALELGISYSALENRDKMEYVKEVDGLGEGYLETEEFAPYKGFIEAAKQSIMAYDMVYTSDMRAIPYVNERRIIVSKGRPLTEKDADGCVVSEVFLDTYGLSIGDKIHVELGDKLLSRFMFAGTRSRTAETMSEVAASTELEIIGAYHFTDEWIDRNNEMDWSYGPGTVFVPSSLLPVEVPKDYEILMGDFSVFVEDPHDIQAFREAAEPMVAEMGLGLRFSDGGWSGMKDSFETGSLASFLTTVLYVLGAALALLLAVYLYIGRNKKSYAIMRTLGVPGKESGRSVTLPLCFLAVVAMFLGGMGGLFYASYTAEKTLAGMSDSSAPDGYVYVLNAALPVGVVIICLVCELLFITLVTLLFLRNMKNASPLELLQEGTGGTAERTGIWRKPFAAAKHTPEIADTAPVPAGLDMERLAVAENVSVQGRYNAFHQVCDYILRHMKRGIGKMAVSLILTVVLAAGIGTFVLARLSYQEAARELEIKGRAMMFTSTYIMELSNSDLIKDIYYYNRFSVRVNGVGVLSPITFTNDFDRYLIDDYTVTYADGYDLSVFDGTGPVCLVGQTLAETLGVHPGGEIRLMSEDLYSFMPQVYAEDELEGAIERAGKPYKVAGILKSEDNDVNNGIFASVNQAAENLYSQPFGVDYCEFTLADNGKTAELNEVLEKYKSKGIQYSPLGSFHIDSDLFETTVRIRNLLDSLFPIAVAAAVLIGLFGPGLLIIQSAQEAAYLRILGVTKKRARCILVLEQMILCIAGTVLVAAVLAVFGRGLFIRGIETLVFCWLLYFMGCILGAHAAAVQVTRYRILELLQVKE